MNVGMMGKLVSLVGKISDLSKSTLNAADSEKYASSVVKLNQDVDATYSVMRDVIMQDKNLSTDEKLERLKQLTEYEEASKKKCDEAIRGNRENVSKVVFEIFKALLTCGISLAPGIIRNIKNAMADAPALPENDEDKTLYLE